MGKTLLVGSTNTSVVSLASGSTQYYIDAGGGIRVRSTSEARAQMRFRTSGTIRNLSVYVVSNSRSTNTVFSTRINGANGNNTVTFAGGATGRQTDTTHTDTVASGDLFCIGALTGTSIGSIEAMSVQIEFEADSGVVSHWTYNFNPSVSFAAASVPKGPVVGAARNSIFNTNTSSDFNKSRCEIGAAATVSNLQVDVVAFSMDINPTLTLWKNGSATALTVSISATGIAEDAAHSVSVAVGDYVEWRLDSTGRTSGGVTLGKMTMMVTSDGDDWDLFSTVLADTDPTVTTGTGYGTVAGRLASDNTTDAKHTILVPFAGTISRLRTGWLNNSAGDEFLTSRINAADGNQQVTIPSTESSAVCYIDTANTDTIAANDLINAKTTTGATTSGPYMIGLTFTNPATSVTLSPGLGVIEVTGFSPTLETGAVYSPGTGTVVVTGIAPSLVTGAVLTAGLGVIEVTGFTPLVYNPAGSAFVSQYGLQSLVEVSADARVSQFGNNAFVKFSADARITQYGLNAYVKTTANARITGMGLLVLAKGGETPLVPDPLTLQDLGREPVLTQRLVNMYSEPTPQGPASSARYGRPGLYEVATRGGGPVRASFLWQGFRITVSGTSVWRDGVNIGTVPAEGHLRYAITDEECVVVAGRRAYYVTLTSVARITDTDLPFVIDVFVLAGRFVYIDDTTDGRFHYSAVGDARTVDGLGFASAESSPDPLVGGAVVGDRMGLFGTKTVEWWYPTTDIDAPFQRSQGQSYSKGLAAIRSLVQADNSLFFVGMDRMVYRSGSVPLRVSNHDVEDRLRRVTDAELGNITAFTVTYGGHTFYVMNLPDQGSWALDIGQRLWAEWKSWGRDRFRVDFAEDNFMGDFYSGKILGFDGGVFTDVGDPIERICSAFAPLRGGMERNFNLALACVRGVGLISGYGSEPVVEMRYSDHEGADWTDWLEQPLGSIGDRSDAAKAVWTQLGAIRPPGRVFEFRCTDPVFFAPYELKINEARP